MRHRLSAAVPVVVGALLLSAGCTGTSRTGTATARPASPSPPGTTPPTRPVELGCADAGSGDPPRAPGDLTVAGLTIEGLSQRASEVPRAAEVGLLVPAGSAQRFRKAPAYLAAGAGPVTIQLVGAAPGQALAWVSASDWSGRPDLRPWMTTTVTLDGCPDRDVTYFGGLLADRADACLDLRIEGANGARTEARLRLDGNDC